MAVHEEQLHVKVCYAVCYTPSVFQRTAINCSVVSDSEVLFDVIAWSNVRKSIITPIQCALRRDDTKLDF